MKLSESLKENCGRRKKHIKYVGFFDTGIKNIYEKNIGSKRFFN